MQMNENLNENLNANDNVKKAYQRLTALCARGEHCQQDLLTKMRQWGLNDQEQALVMERMVSERYVDDERYARAFVSDKVNFAKWGRRKVEQALWMKRIDSDTATRVLNEVDDQQYIDTLRPLLRQKRRTTKAANERELNQKLMRFALSRGFTMDIIRQCMEVNDEDDVLD